MGRFWIVELMEIVLPAPLHAAVVKTFKQVFEQFKL